MNKILLYLAYIIIKAYSFTFRYKEYGLDNFEKVKGKRIVFALWHGQLFPYAYLYRNQGVVGIVSESKDGQIAAFLLKRFGFNISRGSSSRNGTKAIISCKKQMVSGNFNAAITLDGPKGPRLIAKPGAVFLAKITDRVIIPTVWKTNRSFRFNSWDKFMLPYPFATIEVFYGNPLILNENTSKKEIDLALEHLQKNMLELTRENSPDFI